jgi:hypothetical protein
VTHLAKPYDGVPRRHGPYVVPGRPGHQDIEIGPIYDFSPSAPARSVARQRKRADTRPRMKDVP